MNEKIEQEGFDVTVEENKVFDNQEQRVILVVEDDRAYANVLHHKLTHLGHHVVIAENGEVGLERLREIKPDAVVLDILLPVRDGFSFLEELYKDEELSRTSVFVHSNLGQDDDISRARAYDNVLAYFVKAEISVHDVVDHVCHYLSTRLVMAE